MSDFQNYPTDDDMSEESHGDIMSGFQNYPSDDDIPEEAKPMPTIRLLDRRKKKKKEVFCICFDAF